MHELILGQMNVINYTFPVNFRSIQLNYLQQQKNKHILNAWTDRVPVCLRKREMKKKTDTHNIRLDKGQRC